MVLCVCVCVSVRSEEHTSELQSHLNLVCRLLLEKNISPFLHSTIENADTPHFPIASSVMTLNYLPSIDSESALLLYLHLFGHLNIFFFLNKVRPPEFSSFPLSRGSPL